MASSSGTLETLALQLGKLLQPLESLLGPDFFFSLGIELPREIAGDATLLNQLSAASSAASALDGDISTLSSAIGGGNAGSIVSAGAALIASIGKLISALEDVGNALNQAANGLSAADKARLQTFAPTMAARTMEYMLVGYLTEQLPTLTTTLAAVGLIDREFTPSPSLEVSRAPFTAIPRRFYFDRFTQLLTSPDDYFQQTFGWGSSSFDGGALLLKVQALLESLGVPAAIYATAGQPPVLEAYIFNLEADTSTIPPGLKAELSLPGNNTFDQNVPFSTLWQGTVHAQANYPAGVAVTLRPPFAVNVVPPTGSADVDLQMGLKAQRPGADPIVILGVAGSSQLQATSIGATMGLNASLGTAGGALSPEIGFQLKGGQLFIDLSEADGFISDIVGGGDLSSNVDFKLSWSPASGAAFEGSSAIEIAIPTHVTLGPIDIEMLYLSLGPASGALQGALAAGFKASLGPLEASVDQIGLAANIAFPDHGGNLGPANISISFKPPNGVGLAVDASVVSGGGYLSFDPDRGQYSGALQLSFADFLSVTAIGIIETKMPDGSPGFSLLIIITADFGAGIQLGFGFTLLAVGGLLGLNRSVVFEAIADGVRTNAINSAMFPTDVVANAPRIISDLKTFFPPKDGTFLIGPMAKIGWGEPTLVSLALAVVVEIPPGDFAILGVLEAALPAEDVAILQLQVNFIGAFEFDKQRLWFYASLYNSHLLFITIDGSMGVLFDYGNQANFLISVGGFHPQFNPPPLPFPTPTRISVDIINESFARIHADGYFAVTTDTVQFGTDSSYYFGFSALNVQGSSSFDALIQISPFHFTVSFSTSFSVNVFGVGVYGVGISLTLDGPGYWHATGSASISLLFFSIGVGIDISWGQDQPTQLPPVAVMPLLTTEFQKQSNWRAVLPPSSNLLVSLRKLDSSEAQFVLHPVGTLQISQRLVPLDLTLDTFGSQKPSDVNRFSLSSLSAGLTKTRNLQEQFAPAQFVNTDDAAKLSEPAYEPQDSGIELAVTGTAYASGTTITRIVRYDVTIIDTKLVPIPIILRLFNFAGGFFRQMLRGASVALNPLSNFRAAQTHPFTGAVSVAPENFAVAFTSNNTVINAEAASFTSAAAANDYLAQAMNKDPALAGAIHVLPHFELAA